MAIDTVQKRASSVGWYWPTANVDRMASIEEYSGLEAGVASTPMPVGVPELIGPTMRTPTHHLAIGRTVLGLSIGGHGKRWSLGRRGRK